MCSTCLPLLGQWQRLTGRGHQTVTVGPASCPNGHPLRPPNVAISSNVRFISYGCITCGLYVNRLHDEKVEWVTDQAPGYFDARAVMPSKPFD